ncbi:glycine cleavage system protein GcvH [bacterium]|nr:glycine cleavage system protein GcvH [bacterium]
MVKEGLLYTKDHEWARCEGDIAVVGITDYAQGEMGDIVFIEICEVGTKVEQGKPFCTIEAVKAVSDVFAPVSGEVIEVNGDLESSPETINRDPYGDGWIAKIKMSNTEEKKNLLSAKEYRQLIGEE